MLCSLLLLYVKTIFIEFVPDLVFPTVNALSASHVVWLTCVVVFC